MCNTNSNSINFAPLSGEGDNEEEGVEEEDVSGLVLSTSLPKKPQFTKLTQKMWGQISLQASHCQAIIFQLLTTDSSHFFLRSVWGTFEKNPWRLTLKACFVWPKVQSVEMGLPKEKVCVKTEHLDTSGNFLGGAQPRGSSFFMDWTLRNPVATCCPSWPTAEWKPQCQRLAHSWANASILPSYLTLPEMVGKFIELETWMTHPKSSATYKTSLSFWHYRRFLLSFQFLGQKYSQPM